MTAAPLADTADASTVEPLLRVEDLWVTAPGPRRGTTTNLVAGLSFDVRPGEVVALVGESGSGKSTACLAVVGLLAPELKIQAGRVVFGGRDLVRMSQRKLRRIRGADIGMVFQDPLASLNPVRKVGPQLVESRRLHGIDDRAAAHAWAREMLRSLGFNDPERALRSYPLAFSGGMRQRLCVGIAFSAEPRLIIADEPTTALDVSLQGRMLRLLIGQARLRHTATVLISHDINVVRAVADRVVVMYGGRALECGPTEEVLSRPASPYSRALQRTVPTIERAARGVPLATIGSARGEVSADGCPFASRCDSALDRCRAEFPGATTVAGHDGHEVWCWNPGVEVVG